LSTCREHGITLGREKLKFAVNRAEFAGCIVSDQGISADPNKVKAIADFPRPTNIRELRSFLGLVNQLGEFSAEIASKTGPLRPLLRPSLSYNWTSDHENAFKTIKLALTSPPILGTFDPIEETALQTDASRKNGFGYALLQRQSDRWRLIQCGSRFLRHGKQELNG
jgi:hypothetical protein